MNIRPAGPADYDRSTVRALTSPANAASIAFHGAMGFTVTTDPSHNGPGSPRVLFHRRIA